MKTIRVKSVSYSYQLRTNKHATQVEDMRDEIQKPDGDILCNFKFTNDTQSENLQSRMIRVCFNDRRSNRGINSQLNMFISNPPRYLPWAGLEHTACVLTSTSCTPVYRTRWMYRAVCSGSDAPPEELSCTPRAK